MLIDTILEQRTRITLPNGQAYDDLLAPLRKRLAAAQVYVMDPDAVTMAANVSMAKPSSVLAALPWIKLPATSVWIEFSNEDVARAMADLGSPNTQPPNARGRLKRCGFLFREHPHGLEFEYVHFMESGSFGMLAELCSVKGIFDLRETGAPTIAAAQGVRSSTNAVGKVRQHFDMISKDPREAAANDEITDRVGWTDHADLKSALESFPAGPRTSIQVDWVSEMRRLFLLQALPALILLNTRNAVAIEPGPDLAKINRKRVRSGKPPLVEHLVVKLKLSGAKRRKASAQGDGGRAIRGTIVTGHFKVRETGVFWWNPHARAGYGAVTRTTILTR